MLNKNIKDEIHQLFAQLGFKQYNILLWDESGECFMVTNVDIDEPRTIADWFEMELTFTELATRLAAAHKMVSEQAEQVHKIIEAKKWEASYRH